MKIEFEETKIVNQDAILVKVCRDDGHVVFKCRDNSANRETPLYFYCSDQEEYFLFYCSTGWTLYRAINVAQNLFKKS